MKKLLAGLFLISSVSVFAQAFEIIKCEVKEPCKYAVEGELQYCVGTADIRLNDFDGSYFLVSKKNTDNFDVFIIAAKMPIKFKNNQILGNSNFGDNWVELTEANSVYTGTFTLEEDFPFDVTCFLNN